MKKNLRTEENIIKAKLLRESGMTLTEVGIEFGVRECTIRNWLYPEKYQEHIRRALEWQKNNPGRISVLAKNRRKKMTREQKDKLCEYQKKRYRDNPAVRERFKVLSLKYTRTIQGKVGQALRVAALAFSNRLPRSYTKFMESVTGMTREEFTGRFNGNGVFDHIVPLCAFDLSNPEHLVRCCWVNNVRLISKRDNEIKGRSKPEGLNVMALPWAGTDNALIEAKSFIAHQYERLSRMGVSTKQ